MSLYVTLDEATLEIKGSETKLERVPIAANLRHAGTPPAVVEKLDKAIRRALTRPEVKAAFATTTTEVVPLATAELTQLLKADTPKWHALIKAAGIEPQ